MDPSSLFLLEALERLKVINRDIAHAAGTERLALEAARDELIELIRVSVSRMA
jgi:hypothetical protein